MAGTVSYIEPAAETAVPPRFGSDHPMREVTRRIAADDGWWPQGAAGVTAAFDMLSVDWHETHSTDLRLLPLEDALDRGEMGGGRVVELGCGTGAGTERIVRRMPLAAAADISAGMLARADRALAPFVRADAADLPFGAGSVDVLVLLNMFLFAAEADRVLAADGRLVWVNTMGSETPIYLPPEEVVAALPGRWAAMAGYAGEGLWCVARRS